MPVIPVKGTKTRYRIPNVPGTGTKAEKKRQLKAIQASRRKAGKRKR